MPYGIPRTSEEREERHRSLCGEEPPAERIGRPGGRRGVPRTEEERTAMHELYYGHGSNPPLERLGYEEWAETWEMPEDELGISDETLLPVPVAYAIAHPYIAAGAVAAVTGIVHAADVALEKRRRKKAGLPVQPQLAATLFTDIETGTPKFRFTVTGTYQRRRVLLKIGTGKWYGIRDPIIADRYGDGTIDLSGDHLLEEARRKKIIDVGVPQITAGTKRIWIYAQESRPRLGDIRSPITLVEVKVKGVVGKVKEDVATSLLGFKILTPDEAKDLIKAGNPCFIKSIFPIISMFPGLPYTPGMWVPWGCVITDVQ